MNMFKLIIDTSKDEPYVILAKDDSIVKCLTITKKESYSTHIFSSVINLLKNNNISLKDIKYIGCSIGPGSYTGLRIGAAIGKSLAFAENIPLIGYCSMHAIEHIDEKNTFIIAQDAKYRGMYILKAKSNDDKIEFLSNPELITQEDYKKNFSNNYKIFSCDHLKIQEKFKTDNFFIHPIKHSNYNVLNICNKMFNNKEFSLDTNLNFIY